MPRVRPNARVTGNPKNIPTMITGLFMTEEEKAAAEKIASYYVPPGDEIGKHSHLLQIALTRLMAAS